MFIFFILIFAVVPLTEVYLFIEVGHIIGAWNTILLALLTAVIGVTLVKKQGLNLVLDMQKKAMINQAPLDELFDALCLLIAALLLITPGFLTDFIGFALLVPPLRQLMRRFMFDRLLQKFTASWFTVDPTSPPAEDSRVIEGDFEVIDKNAK